MKIKAMPTFLMMTSNKNKEWEVMDKVVGANPKEIKKRIAAFIQFGCIQVQNNVEVLEFQLIKHKLFQKISLDILQDFGIGL